MAGSQNNQFVVYDKCTPGSLKRTPVSLKSTPVSLRSTPVDPFTVSFQ